MLRLAERGKVEDSDHDEKDFDELKQYFNNARINEIIESVKTGKDACDLVRKSQLESRKQKLSMLQVAVFSLFSLSSPCGYDCGYSHHTPKVRVE